MDIISLFQQMFTSPFLALLFFLGYTWAAKTDGVDTYEAEHINRLQTEKMDRDGEIEATGTIQWDKGNDIVSAATLVPGADGNYFDVTAMNAITAINATQSQPGTVICLHFDGILTLTHDATDLILPGGANITTAAGDEAIFMEYTTDKWRCISYTKASGEAIISTTPDFADGGEVGGAKRTLGNTDANIIAFITNNADGIVISAAGEVTKPLQPCFLATAVQQNNVTGDATLYTIQFTTEIFDQGADFDGTSTFTAPVTGRYEFQLLLYITGITANHGELKVDLVTSNRTYILHKVEVNSIDVTGIYSITSKIIADMDAADTAHITIAISAVDKVVDITANDNYFSGCLLA